MLAITVKLFQNPWDHTIPDLRLYDILDLVAARRAEHIEKMYDDGNGEWPRNSLGLAFLNPAAPRWQPTPDTLLATIAIGDEGERFVVNAVAKAAYHRDHGLPAGYGAYVDLSMSIDGDFCYGYSAQVDGLIAGASALSEIQDACEAGHAAVSLLYYLRKVRAEWKQEQESEPHWFCNLDAPLGVYTEMVNQEPIMESSVG